MVSGCTSDKGTIAFAPSPSWTEVTTEPAWELDGYTVFGEVSSAGEVFILHALNAEDELVALGIEAETGERRWEYFATYSSTVAGVQFDIDTSGARAVFMQVTDLENSFSWPDIALLDVNSGAVQWRYYGGAVTAAPAFCGTDNEFVCFTSWLRGSGSDMEFQHIVLDAESGALVSTAVLQDPRRLETELFIDADGNLMRIDLDGVERWLTPVSDLFGSNDLSPDNGWGFELHEEGFYYGGLGLISATDEEGHYEADLSLGAVAAFDQETGESIWIEAGVTRCPVFGMSEEAPVRCRADATFTSVDEEGTFEGTMSIEGFDPVTGRSTWTWEAEGLGEALYTESDTVLQVTETVYLLALPSGKVLIDLSTGATSSAEGQVPLWCSEAETIRPGRLIHDDEDYNGRATVNRWPCDQNGAPTGEVVTVPEFAGPAIGDHFAWIDGERLHAVRIID
ncbi:hypothetical protein SAMN05216270_12641 [Glycomyces harbinensis]|uniref:PQQ-like domain-containing protein n=2 Tax=Glycomyces harbinensis TaxID=58114 RepID=A0A1G7DMA0_9ACTN|nr:hypothetical protein SAMN05216270_12641 [Glycomyces harbinensis]